MGKYKIYLQARILLILAFTITNYCQKSLVWQGGNPYHEVIKIANIDGSNIRDLYDVKIKEPAIMAIDKTKELLFWYDRNLQGVMSCNLDGSGIEEIYSESDTLVIPEGIAIDEQNSKLYISEYTTSRIFRANLDGSQKEYLNLNHISAPAGLVIDSPHERLYWLESQGSQRFRVCTASLLSDNVSILIDTAYGYSTPFSITLDTIHNKLYWVLLSNDNGDKIMSSNIDGSNMEEVINSDDGLVFPIGITIDNVHEKIYFQFRS